VIATNAPTVLPIASPVPTARVTPISTTTSRPSPRPTASR
jgi:hypothetical protein